MSEDQHQEALFRWAALSKIPELDLMYAVPNGGLRNVRVAVKLKAGGVKSGVPDICLPTARGSFHGLYIELKKPKCSKSPAGKPTKNQIEWLQKLNDAGYLAVTCIGWDEAKKAIETYLMLEC